ncbi:MAG: hypothetical protein ACOX5R_03330 [bacterium]|jgi:hypothetical protein
MMKIRNRDIKIVEYILLGILVLFVINSDFHFLTGCLIAIAGAIIIGAISRLISPYIVNAADQLKPHIKTSMKKAESEES